MDRLAPDRIAVVVPAHQEQRLIAGAVEALLTAADRVSSRVETVIVVVANGCTDQTADLARAAGAHVVEVDVPNVGSARATGFTWAVEHTERHDRLWLATTDADSRVPRDWLRMQLEAAAEGADAYLGTVGLAPRAQTTFAAWIARYHAAFESPERHGHIHGASMGMRAEAYRRAGGFRPLARSEDADLVERLIAAGENIVWDASCPVLTSSRLTARAPAGVSRDLALSLTTADEQVASAMGNDQASLSPR